jgi:Phospholipase A2-like domain
MKCKKCESVAGAFGKRLFGGVGKCRCHESVRNGNGARKTIKSKKNNMDKLICKLPVELHIPGYNFCGPGTKLNRRMHLNGINKLDEACKEHDLAYAKFESSDLLREADEKLISIASDIIRDSTTPLSEKFMAIMVRSTIKMKCKFF